MIIRPYWIPAKGGMTGKGGLALQAVGDGALEGVVAAEHGAGPAGVELGECEVIDFLGVGDVAHGCGQPLAVLAQVVADKLGDVLFLRGIGPHVDE